jgi:Short C-terminal domain
MPLRRRGIAGTMARTAVIAGTATAVSGRVARRQNARYDQKADAEAYNEMQQAPPQQYAAPPPQQYAAPAPAPAGDPVMDQIEQLAQLHAQGILTDEEFSAKKAQLLGI